MLLGAALQEMKIMQSKLSRLYRLRESTFNVLENKEVEVEFDKVTEEIEKLIFQIRALKVRIVKTNANTAIRFQGEDITIQELIIQIGDLRSELSRYAYLQPLRPVYLGGTAVQYIPQKRQDKIAEMIAELEEKKADLDKVLQSTNWKTELLD